jgi:hypothetical protein
LAQWHIPIIPATAGSINRRIAVQVNPGRKEDPTSKITTAKRAEGISTCLASLKP